MRNKIFKQSKLNLSHQNACKFLKVILKTGERPFKCISCNKSYVTFGVLKNHMSLHSREKPYKCGFEGCIRTFSFKKLLLVHEKSHVILRIILFNRNVLSRMLVILKDVNRKLQIMIVIKNPKLKLKFNQTTS